MKITLILSFNTQAQDNNSEKIKSKQSQVDLQVQQRFVLKFKQLSKLDLFRMT